MPLDFKDKGPVKAPGGIHDSTEYYFSACESPVGWRKEGFARIVGF